MALNALALLTLDEARAAVGLKNSSSDTDLELIVNALTVAFEIEVRGPLKQRTISDYRLDGNGKNEIMLPFAPIQSVTKVEIRNGLDDSVMKVISDTSKFVLKDRERAILLLKEDVFTRGMQNILITMNAGYLATDIQMDFAKNLLTMQLSASWQRFQNKEWGITSKTLADGAITFSSMPTMHYLLKEVRDGLSTLRDWYQ
jgi:hypothetical protein